ncbi:Asparagine synthase, glutamine-hydrolyzing [Planctomycetales bacterium 10988]|nr:Asparagine synthase, glutamine-hydrolyzing [Planctomycetales bacterium 10988]
MCGIAGVIDLRREQEIDPQVVQRMAAAIEHRGPDEEGYFYEDGLALASRRLSIVGLADGQQPIHNEDRTVTVVFNGEFFDFPEKRAWLESRGHHFRTSCDTEILVHLWEEYGEEMLTHLRGQYAFALYDARQQKLLIARDRIGIVPLHWARRGNFLYFCSEIKGILASGEVKAEVDHRGLDHIFTFFAMPTKRTCFRGISALLPGSCLSIRFQDAGQLADINERTYWDLDFPDQGEEFNPKDENEVIEGFKEKFHRATEIRLRADVPVVSYLSGGVDSTTVLSVASRIKGSPVPSFTIDIPTPELSELDRALAAAKTVGSKPTVVTCGSEAVSGAYPKLVEASESPVTDTSCAAMLCLAEEVRNQGYKVALTGEGSDEALAGYPWLKVNRLLCMFDRDGLRPSNLLRQFFLKIRNPKRKWSEARRYQDHIGGPYGITDLYALISVARFMFYSEEMFDHLDGHSPFQDLPINLDRINQWSPLNRAIYIGYKTMLPGLLMHHKGDRPAMHNSVETRYPFLDEEVVDYCAKLHPKYKLRGLFRDKYLLRKFSSDFLPESITNRPKTMFRAPFANSFFENPPAYVNQLLSQESLRKTGYFNPEKVQKARDTYNAQYQLAGKRLLVEMGLTGVMATQIWHHLYFGGDLCELPSWTAPEPEVLSNT